MSSAAHSTYQLTCHVTNGPLPPQPVSIGDLQVYRNYRDACYAHTSKGLNNIANLLGYPSWTEEAQKAFTRRHVLPLINQNGDPSPGTMEKIDSIVNYLLGQKVKGEVTLITQNLTPESLYEQIPEAKNPELFKERLELFSKFLHNPQISGFWLTPKNPSHPQTVSIALEGNSAIQKLPPKYSANIYLSTEGCKTSRKIPQCAKETLRTILHTPDPTCESLTVRLRKRSLGPIEEEEERKEDPSDKEIEYYFNIRRSPDAFNRDLKTPSFLCRTPSPSPSPLKSKEADKSEYSELYRSLRISIDETLPSPSSGFTPPPLKKNSRFDPTIDPQQK